MNNYLNSKDHKKQFKECSNKGRVRLQELKKARVANYNSTPTKCKHCNCNLIYEKRANKFCSKSCSASFNNSKRKHSDEVKIKIGLKIKENYEKGLTKKRNIFGENNPNYIKIIPKTICKICGEEFKQERRYQKGRLSGFKNRKTCSRKCQTIASVKIRTYQNGSRKTTWLFNPFENKKVLLESSWEVKIAKLLIDKNIKWIRPEPLEWIDSENKKHLYFPDFYLEAHALFLDPKNPYCMEKDKEKMKYISMRHSIYFGDIKYIESIIENL